MLLQTNTTNDVLDYTTNNKLIIRNDQIRQRIKIDATIIDTTEAKSFEMVQPQPEEGAQRRNSMTLRNLQDEDRKDQNRWQLVQSYVTNAGILTIKDASREATISRREAVTNEVVKRLADIEGDI